MAAGSKNHPTLGQGEVFSLSAGAMISSGIFLLPGLAFAHVGPAVSAAYLLAGVFALLGALATIELATAMPRAGGIYFYTGRSLGPLAGTIAGFLSWSAIALKSAFAIFGLAAILHSWFQVNSAACAIGLTVLFLVTNLWGTREAAIAQNIMVALLLAAMAAYVVMGLPVWQPSRLWPLFHPGKGALALFGEAAFVFVSFGGLLDVVSITEEVRSPQRSLPRGMLGALVTVTVTYFLTVMITVGALPAEALSASLTPLSDAAGRHYGSPGVAVITCGALLAFITTANSGIMSAARFPYAMARDRLLPACFGGAWGRRQIPLASLVLTAGAMALAQLLPLEHLVSVASTVIMLSFILTNTSVIILRESNILNYRPTFRVPGYPWLPLFNIVLFSGLIVTLGAQSIEICLAVFFLGVLFYFSFGRRVKLEYALLSLIQRVSRHRLPQAGLERELRKILFDREGIVADAFDHVIETSAIVLLDKPCKFGSLAREICMRHLPFGEHGRYIARQLEMRERQSSTLMSPFAAAPHLVIEGRGRFEFLAVKCAEGVAFPGAHHVRAVFFLFSTPDQCDRHIEILAALAQIVRNPDFEEQWRQADSAEALRSLLMLTLRSRTPSSASPAAEG